MHGDPVIQELKKLLPQCLLHDQVRLGLALTRYLDASRHKPAPPEPLLKWREQARASIDLRHHKARSLPAITYPPDLPISPKAPEIVEMIRKHQVLVIIGETGSGKTTQIPKMCLEAGYGVRAQIGLTQPRRIAAQSISQRLAEELGFQWGEQVGCKIRFADHTSPRSCIKVMTDGILLAEVQSDPLLAHYDAIILDEAHERSLNIDFLLGYLKLLLQKRDDLKLIITSATIDARLFSNAFAQAPIVEVSGKLFPVDVVYEPDMVSEDGEEDFTHIQMAAQMVDRLLLNTDRGNILVFLPGERDIRETFAILDNGRDNLGEIIPLYGRLSSREQHRVFDLGGRRKVILATNIAETSLTIPGIRYVVDAGLARLSRYNPRTRTRCLPIEPVSQSSADQRKGRAGRVSEGVCIRLYSESDYLSRPKHTPPEILRSNLAEVILRMKAMNLGDIESFPFVEPPAAQSIRLGLELLCELAALDDKGNLTPLGIQLARLPMDPSIGRMILQAQRENALSEVTIIASGLSMQDPRERPFNKEAEALAAQKVFVNPESDFLTLLNIWRAFHEVADTGKSQGAMRRFCKNHYLSFIRIREWVDTYAQIEDCLDDMDGFVFNTSPASGESIHRSILSGLLGHIGQRVERNFYQSSGNRKAMIFPSSTFFSRTVPSKKKSNIKESPAARKGQGQPEWVMAAEFMDTSRLFMRTLAGIEPEWLMEMAPHLCERTWQDEHWDMEQGRVLVRERVRFKGLLLEESWIDYGKIKPKEATEMFIQSALVEGNVEGHLAFLEKNRDTRKKIELWQTRMHRQSSIDLDRRISEFYSRQITNVSSVHDLNRLIKESHKTNPRFLQFSEADLVGDEEASAAAAQFPNAIRHQHHALAVKYAYSPGDDRDGATIQLSAPCLDELTAEALYFSIPGLVEDQLLHLLEALPKLVRRRLMPLPVKAKDLAQRFEQKKIHSSAELSALFRELYQVEIPESDWAWDQLPTHLRPRFEITTRSGRVMAGGRDVEAIKKQLAQSHTSEEKTAWDLAARKWEKYGLTNWDFELPGRSVTVSDCDGVVRVAHLGLQVENDGVNLRLFHSREEADLSHKYAVPLLARKVLQRDLGWVEKELRALEKVAPLYVRMGTPEELKETALDNLCAHLFTPPDKLPLTRTEFMAYLDQMRGGLFPCVPPLLQWVGAILDIRQKVLTSKYVSPGIRAEVDGLLRKPFLRTIPYHQLQHVPRYLKAILVRAERASLNPVKDAAKVERIKPYILALGQLNVATLSPAKRAQLQALRWMIEEYKVSCFAQELGTQGTISERVLDYAVAELKQS